MQCNDMTVVSSVSLTSGHDGAALGAGRGDQGGQGDRHQPRHRCQHLPHDLRGQCLLLQEPGAGVRAVFMYRRPSCLLPPWPPPDHCTAQHSCWTPANSDIRGKETFPIFDSLLSSIFILLNGDICDNFPFPYDKSLNNVDSFFSCGTTWYPNQNVGNLFVITVRFVLQRQHGYPLNLSTVQCAWRSQQGHLHLLLDQRQWCPHLNLCLLP